MPLYIHSFRIIGPPAKDYSCAANAGLPIKEVDFVATLDRPAAYGYSMMC